MTDVYQTVRTTTVTRKPGRPAKAAPELPRIESPTPAIRQSLEIVAEQFAPSGYVLVEGWLPVGLARVLCRAVNTPA